MGGDAADAAGGNVDPVAAMGIDENLDPEMAMAIRMSLEMAEESKAADEAAQPQPEAVGANQVADESVQPGLAVADEDDGMYDDAGSDEGDEDERLLAEALALSIAPRAEEAQPEIPEVPQAVETKP
jgi:hypothetical protein